MQAHVAGSGLNYSIFAAAPFGSADGAEIQVKTVLRLVEAMVGGHDQAVGLPPPL